MAEALAALVCSILPLSRECPALGSRLEPVFETRQLAIAERLFRAGSISVVIYNDVNEQEFVC
eukprot:347-Prymnesium_polylepis.1